jgi:hypothetical protein
MSKFLIEVPHGADKMECLRSIAIFLSSGSHFLTNAEWGCKDHEHKAWFFMETDTKEQALQVVPPAYRKDAKITELSRFRLEQVQRMMEHHKD